MITGFQIKVARKCLSLRIQDVAQRLGIHSSTLQRLENTTGNLTYLKCSNRVGMLLKNFFLNHNISFPRYNSIYVNISSVYSKAPLSSFQLKASRIAVKLTLKQLSKKVEISADTIKSWENKKHIDQPITAKNTEDIKKIISFFETNGIRYHNNNGIELV